MRPGIISSESEVSLTAVHAEFLFIIKNIKTYSADNVFSDLTSYSSYHFPFEIASCFVSSYDLILGMVSLMYLWFDRNLVQKQSRDINRELKPLTVWYQLVIWQVWWHAIPNKTKQA